MAVQFVNGQVLFVGGVVAMDPACCCEEPPAPCVCPYTNDEGENPAPDFTIGYVFEGQACGGLLEAGGDGCAWSNGTGCNGKSQTIYLSQVIVDGVCMWGIGFLDPNTGNWDYAYKATGLTPEGVYTDGAIYTSVTVN
jgi:hypothetical protein